MTVPLDYYNTQLPVHNIYFEPESSDLSTFYLGLVIISKLNK